MRSTSAKLKYGLFGALTAVAMSAGMVSFAQAQSPLLLLACTPTPEAMDQCSNQGGKFNTKTCKCVMPKSKGLSTSVSRAIPRPCALVCIDGKLDAKKCRCVKD